MSSFTVSRLIYLSLAICFLPVHSRFNKNPDLDVIYQWSQLEYDYSSEYERQAEVESGNFVPGNPIVLDVDVYHSSDDNVSSIFVASPRFNEGVPAALGIVSSRVRNGNPIITPYPSWDWHKNPEQCKTNRIISVYRVMIDECERLWVLDNGRLLDKIECPPQLLAFDLKTNELLYRYEIPASQIESRSILVTPIVEVRNKTNQCLDTFVYIADCQAFSIIVYDLNRQTSWRVSDKTMYPYPNYGTYSILGDSFDLMDGILGMSLSPASPEQERKLFYHAMSSPTENWVFTSHLRNETRFSQNPSSSPEIFNTYPRQRHTQSGAEAISKDGIMFYGLMSDVKIACFNIKGDYGDWRSTDIVADNPVTLQFASGIKVIKNRIGEEELFVLTSRYQKVATSGLNTSEINFRILGLAVDPLISGKNCRVEIVPSKFVSLPWFNKFGRNI